MKKQLVLGLLLALMLAVVPAVWAQDAEVVAVPDDIAGTISISIEAASLVADGDAYVLTISEYGDLASISSTTAEGLDTGIYSTEDLAAAWSAYNSNSESGEEMVAGGYMWIITEGIDDEEISALLLADDLPLLYFELTAKAMVGEDEAPTFEITFTGGDELDKTIEEGLVGFGSAMLFIEFDAEVGAVLQAGTELRRPTFGQNCIFGISCP